MHSLYPGDTYKPTYDNEMFGTADAISSKNLFDVQNCDFTLAYMPDIGLSIGTIVEVAWASAFRKPVILVAPIENQKIRRHPVLMSCKSWLLADLDQAVETLIGVLKDYAEVISND